MSQHDPALASESSLGTSCLPAVAETQDPGLPPLPHMYRLELVPQGTPRSQKRLQILLQTNFIDSPLGPRLSVHLQALTSPSNAPNNRTPVAGAPRLAYL